MLYCEKCGREFKKTPDLLEHMKSECIFILRDYDIQTNPNSIIRELVKRNKILEDSLKIFLDEIDCNTQETTIPVSKESIVHLKEIMEYQLPLF